MLLVFVWVCVCESMCLPGNIIFCVYVCTTSNNASDDDNDDDDAQTLFIIREGQNDACM